VDSIDERKWKNRR